MTVPGKEEKKPVGPSPKENAVSGISPAVLFRGIPGQRFEVRFRGIAHPLLSLQGDMDVGILPVGLEGFLGGGPGFSRLDEQKGIVPVDVRPAFRKGIQGPGRKKLKGPAEAAAEAIIGAEPVQGVGDHESSPPIRAEIV
jgi:hypothetical protein